MNWKKARMLSFVFAVLALIFFPLGSALQNEPMIYLSLLSYIFTVLLWLIWNRCPHCRAHLGRNTTLYCPRCGKKL